MSQDTLGVLANRCLVTLNVGMNSVYSKLKLILQ